MEQNINRYFPQDSIFHFDDEDNFSGTQNGEESDPLEEKEENGDVFVPRGGVGSRSIEDTAMDIYLPPNGINKSSDDENEDTKNVKIRSKQRNCDLPSKELKENGDVFVPREGLDPTSTDEVNINEYFPPESIFRSSDDESEETEQVKIRSKPKSPRVNWDLTELEKMVLPIVTGEEKIPPKSPKIKVEDIDNKSIEESIYDSPPHPLPIQKSNKRLTFLEESQMTDKAPLESRRGSCPGFIGTWERYSLMNQRYDNLLADEGLETSGEYEVVRYLSKSDSHQPLCRKKSLKEMLLTVFPNRIFLSLSDNEIDSSKEVSRLPAKSKHRNKKTPCTFRHMKDFMSSKCKNFRSTVGAVIRGNFDCSLQLVATFCVPAGCANVSSITKYDHGQCWVAAEQSESILLYDREGNLLDLVNIGCPVDSLTTDKDGNIFMSCPDLKQVRVFDRNRHVKTFLDMTQFPRGIAYMKSDDSILVCRNNVKIANDLTRKACNPLKKYLLRGRTSRRAEEIMDTRFGYPFRVCVNENNDCVVSDFANRNITVLDSKGRTRFCFKSSNDFPIRNRHSVCCDPKGYIYIISKGKPNVCILEPNGNIKDMFSCIDLFNEIVFAAVFDSDGFLWTACLDGFIKIFKLSL